MDDDEELSGGGGGGVFVLRVFRFHWEKQKKHPQEAGARNKDRKEKQIDAFSCYWDVCMC